MVPFITSSYNVLKGVLKGVIILLSFQNPSSPVTVSSFFRLLFSSLHLSQNLVHQDRVTAGRRRQLRRYCQCKHRTRYSSSHFLQNNHTEKRKYQTIIFTIYSSECLIPSQATLWYLSNMC